jgi:hypothetical protein
MLECAAFLFSSAPAAIARAPIGFAHYTSNPFPSILWGGIANDFRAACI